MKRYTLPLLLLPLTALAAGGNHSYTCEDGSKLRIAYATSSEGQPLAIVHAAGTKVTLPQVLATVGKLYRVGETRLHTRTDEVIYQDGHGHNYRCQPASAQSIRAATPPAAASSFLDISGRIFYYSRTALPPDAIMVVRIQDTVRGRKRTLAEQQIDLAGQTAPIAFQTTIDRDLIGRKANITVNASIEQNGQPLFRNNKSHPALSKGQPIPVDMQLQKVADDQPR